MTSRNQSFRNFIKHTSFFDGRSIFLSYAVLVMMYPLIELNCNTRTKAITLILSDLIKDSERLEDVLKKIGVQDCKPFKSFK